MMDDDERRMEWTYAREMETELSEGCVLINRANRLLFFSSKVTNHLLKFVSMFSVACTL
jgi:hypothetical protein